MGYSCAAAASYTLDAIDRILDQRHPGRGSNSMPDGGFYERGRENKDGAITGTVWRKLNAAEKAKWSHLDQLDTRIVKRGSYRIEPSGKVARFAGLDRPLIHAAECLGAATYQERHGGTLDWRGERDAAIRCLDCAPPPPLECLWDGVQRAAAGYQQEKRIAFLALPSLNETALREFLTNLT